jgi:hypothetical protein
MTRMNKENDGVLSYMLPILSHNGTDIETAVSSLFYQDAYMLVMDDVQWFGE